MWWKCNAGYINSQLIGVLEVRLTGSQYSIAVKGDNVILNAGPYSTAAEPETALRKLVQGVDPATIV
ncbi:hypothetical protein ABT294_00615 [Nonomuraea sp. NPDC000554]|uniref:hypothetical protein n=1 Tax=Nonomuraea sp. NPDC000554 TaxID=3154259 RepID=UPI0033254C89